ncbi:hypothetical protein KGM_212086 [Danaus plexippus plexippus]|uniref:T-box domain-containing protein n=1 Tax=Danaus plexippus plexippus TaxID=278856 RepID=A0A212F0R2_DANPL|nr:hypothetical protein KGM_212086 [Danaus plexippus plexippus]
MMDQAHFGEYLLRQQMLHAASLGGLQPRVSLSAEPPSCEGRLLNGDLWRRFHDIGTEMIITKGGRPVKLYVGGDLSSSDVSCDEFEDSQAAALCIS